MSSSVEDDLPEPARIETLGDGDAAAMDGQPLTATMHLTFNADGVSEISYRWQSSADGRSWTSIPGASNARLLSRQPEHGLSLTLALTYIFIGSAFSPDTAYAAPAFAPAPGNSGVSGRTSEIPPDMAWDYDSSSGNSEHSAETVTVSAPDAGGSFGNGGALLELSSDIHIRHGSGVPVFLLAGGPALFGNGGMTFAYAGRGDNIVHGGEGNDTLFGGKGNDTLYGEGGDDRLFGGLGNDHLHGGEGDDLLSGGQGDDVLAGEAGNDALGGGDGADVASGGAGDDTVSGDAGDDTVSGGEGDDAVSGGEGDDTVSGGAGNDTLYGGLGHDVFVYRYGDGNDSIMDFEDGHDELKFDGDDVTYEVNDVDYGRDYTFKNGQVLAVHSNSGKGSQNSGSDHSGSGSGEGDGYEDEFDYADFGNQSVYDSIPGTGGDDEWADLVATGVIDAPNLDTPPAEDYAPLADLYNDQGLHTILGVSTITFSHEDHNLFG